VRYRGFISYSWQDKAWARRIHRWLETYRVPKGAAAVDDASRKLGKFFRDDDDMPAATDIGKVVRQAIDDCENLIVLCSPRSAQSKWVNAEIAQFRKRHPGGSVFAIIIDGVPNAADPDEECFPAALRVAYDPDDSQAMPIEPVGIDLRRDGKHRVCARLAAGMLGIDFDDLWRRDQRRAETRQRRIVGGLSALTIVFAVLMTLAIVNAQRAHDALSRFFVERAWQKLETGETLLAARYALAGRLVAPNTEAQSLAALAAIMHAAGESDRPLVHEAPVTSATFSADGALAATASSDGVVKIWDEASGAMRATVKSPAAVIAVAFSADGERVITADVLGNFRVWGSRTGAALAAVDLPNARLRAAGVFPDGRRAFGPAEDNSVRIVDMNSGRLLVQTGADPAHVLSVAASPDGALLALARGADGVAVRDAATGRLRVQFGEGEVFQARFSPDGRRVVTATGDGIAAIWDASSGRMVRELIGHESGVLSAAFSPDGRRVVTASVDRTARVWNAVTGKQVLLLEGHKQFVSDATYSRDGRAILTAGEDGSARVWDATTGRQTHALRGQVGAVSASLSPGGERAVTWGADSSARIWRLTGPRDLLAGMAAERLYSAEYSPDGRVLAASSGAGRALLFAADSGKLLAALSVPGGEVYTVAFAPDGRTVLTTSEDGALRLWDWRSQRALGEIAAGSAVNAAVFAPDQSAIAAASQASFAGIWPIAGGQPARRLNGHTGGVLAAAYSPDGRLIATGSEDFTTILWDAARGEQIAILGGHDRGVGVVAFSTDGKRLVTASDDTTAAVWDVKRRVVRSVFPGAGAPIISAQFSPDGARLFTGDAAGRVQVSDVASGRLLATLQGPGRGGLEVAVSADGHTLAAASQDGALLVWDVHRLTTTWAILARDACIRLLGREQRVFSQAEIDQDSLLRSLWSDPARDVCADVERGGRR
jgi:WD40 repeat protein